jgi:membrane protease YdiL (CAAX protease family)
LGYVFLFFRFWPTVDWQHLPGLIKLVLLPLLLFMFPIALAIYLLLKKYKLPNLGLRLNGLLLVLPIVFISAIINHYVSPQSLTLTAVLEESGGWFGAIFSGFIVAALSEEFFRFVGQTRLGAYFNNKGIAWFVTSLLWAFMHAPKWYGEELNMTEAVLGSLRIVPIGLMWGYLTHRTKSILPSVLVHGMNVWGLQNF